MKLHEMIFRPVDAALLTLFGFGRGASPSQRNIGQNLDVKPDIQSDPIKSWYNQQMGMVADRHTLYKEYEGMDMSDILSSALDLYTEDTLRQDSVTGRSVWPAADNPNVQAILDDTFRTLRFEERSFELVRAFIKYGDVFASLVQGLNSEGFPTGLTNMKVIIPSEVEVVMDGFGRVQNYQLGSSSQGSSPTPNADLAQPWEIGHFRLPGKQIESSYGTSILFSSRRIWRILKMVEDALALYRIKRSPDRLLWKVDMTSTSADERYDILNEFKKAVTQKSYVDEQNTDARHEVLPWDTMSDIFLPVTQESQTDVTTLKGAGVVGNIFDVEYFRRRLFSTLRIPEDYMGTSESSSGLNSTSSLAEQDVRYSRTIKRIQKAFMVAINQICQVDLVMRGIDIFKKENEFRIAMNPPSYIEEQQIADVAKTRASTVAELLSTGKEVGLTGNAWKRYVANLSGFPEDLQAALTESSDGGLQALKSGVFDSMFALNKNSVSSHSYLAFNKPVGVESNQYLIEAKNKMKLSTSGKEVDDGS